MAQKPYHNGWSPPPSRKTVLNTRGAYLCHPIQRDVVNVVCYPIFDSNNKNGDENVGSSVPVSVSLSSRMNRAVGRSVRFAAAAVSHGNTKGCELAGNMSCYIRFWTRVIRVRFIQYG